MLDAIWYALCLMWLCLKWAWRGSWDKASAQAAVVGTIILWAGAALLGYRIVIPDDLAEAIAFTLLCIGAAWVAIFVFRLIMAPGVLYHNAETALAEIKEQIRPKLKCSFSMSDAGCVVGETELTTATIAGEPFAHRTTLSASMLLATLGTKTGMMYCRVKVESNCLIVVRQCKGRLLSINRNGEVVFEGGPLILPFAPAEHEDAIDKHIHPHAPEYLDFMGISDNNAIILTPYKHHAPSAVNYNTIFREHGEYRMKLAVLCDGPTAQIDLIFSWTGDRTTSTIVQV